jgi:excinuclease UvrABC ATPase subunit
VPANDRTVRRTARHDVIRVVGARENNLRDVSLEIAKEAITIFTGVSGSGKSSLVFDTIAAESQRQLNETFSAFIRHRLPHYGQPDADALENLSPAIIVDQQRLGGTARSTVGTATDIYTLLRLLFSRVGQPFVGYSQVFSFNHPDGMCPACEGIGTVVSVDVDALIDRSRSLNEGAIRFASYAIGSYRWKRYVRSGYFDNDLPLADYSVGQWQRLLHAEAAPPEHPGPGWWPSASYEGILPRFRRDYLTKDAGSISGAVRADLDRVVTRGPCPACNGTRLNARVRACRIDGRSIADCAALPVDELVGVIEAIDEPIAVTMVAAIGDRLRQLIATGLGYLSLDRQTGTLSGGESQRVKLVRHLGSSLSGMSYIFDEPSTGLHPHDVHRLNGLLRELRDRGNTILVVEHDPDVIAIADCIVDMGPGAGRDGGEVVYAGDLAGLLASGTLTGRCLGRARTLNESPRRPTGWIPIEHASLHNLRDVSVRVPTGVLTVVSGVAGSGKSSLISGVLARQVAGVVRIDQSALRGSRRSSAATYTGLLDGVRRLFARENAESASLFSSNSAGACPVCKGLGETSLDLAFMDPIVSICEACAGRRFTDEALAFAVRGRNISDVLSLTMDDAVAWFGGQEPELAAIARRVANVGLGYMTLGQPLSSLSGGERQRIKLATLLGNAGGVYVLDEPTSGLHLSDVDRLLALLDRLVDDGSTLVVIEHDLEVIARADWVIDMGPGAGRDGGRVLYEGPPAGLAEVEGSVTGSYLAGG